MKGRLSCFIWSLSESALCMNWCKRAKVCTQAKWSIRPARPYPSFYSMKRLEVFLPSPRWDASPSIKFTSTHLYTWAWRGTVRVKCLAQEHNTVFPARTWTWTAHIALTMRPRHLHQWNNVVLNFCSFFFSHYRGESFPDRQESPETKSKRGPEGTESLSCIFAWLFFGGDYKSPSTSVMSLCCRPSLTSDERQRVLRWACLIHFSAIMRFAQEGENKS